MRKLLLTILPLFLAFFLQSQQVIQFSGIIVTGDSLQPVPYTSISVENTHRGTMSDYFGFFSLVAQENDTIKFASLGFKDASFVIPDSLTENKYSLIQLLMPDTIMLPETKVYPWPSKEEFKEAFLALNVQQSELSNGRRNLNAAQMIALAENMAADGSENFKYQMQQDATRLYTAGQAPQNNLLNPLAWSEFIRAWRNGAFKKKKKKDTY
ncbi:MAG: carboxypeptidase-like regulatory domain-containing protein [Bacteroidota bacterium]